MGLSVLLMAQQQQPIADWLLICLQAQNRIHPLAARSMATVLTQEGES